MIDLVLASASPRRKEILETAGLVARVKAADVDETALAGEAPEAYARRVAEAKAQAVAERVARGQAGVVNPSGALVLGADTIVVTAAGALLGKPHDAADARRMIEALSGQEHTVLTGVALWEARGGVARARLTGLGRTAVDVRALRPAEIDGYVASGEWEGKAGAYAVQGVFGAFVRGLRGSWANVVGLPIFEVVQMLYEVGYFAGRPFPAAREGT
jgi:septum formation protein